MYRYNSFLKDEGSTSLIRVHNKEYRIKKSLHMRNCLNACHTLKNCVKLKP